MSKRPKSYIDAMNAFRGKGGNAAVAEVPKRKVLSKRKRNLTGTRKARSLLKSARSRARNKRTTTSTERLMMARAKRRKSKVARKNGRFAKAGTTRKRRRSASAPAVANPRKKKRAKAKRRSMKRKRPGHHKHTVKSHLRKVRGKKRRVRVKRHRSHEDAVANPRRAKRRGKKRKGVRGRKRHVVRGHYRKLTRSKSRKRAHVKRHLSWEEKAKRARRARRAKKAREELAMAAKPRRRRRRKAARETVAVANPRRRRKARRRAARETVLANPRRRSRKSSRRKARKNPRMRAVVPAVVRRRSKRGGPGRARPASLKIELVTRGSSRRSSKRSKKRSYAKKRKSARKKRKYTRRTPMSRRLPPASELLLGNPIGNYGMSEYTMSNPLSRGELLLAAAAGGVGFVITDVLDRYLAIKFSTLTPGVTQQQFVEGPPHLIRMVGQLAVAGLAFGGAHFVKNDAGRATLQGAGLGAIVHLAGQVIKSYVIGNLLSSNATVQQLFPDTIAANAAITAAQGATGATGTVAGFFGLGRRPAAAPYGLGYRDVGPRAGVGQPAVGAIAPSSIRMSTPQTPVSTFAAGQPAQPGQPGCSPCAQPCGPTNEQQAYSTLSNVMPVASAETMNATINSAYNAALAENCAGGSGSLNGVPSTVLKTKAHLTFPD